MRFTKDQLIEMMDANDGNLCLSVLPITELPDGLEVEHNLDLSDSRLTALPKGLHVGGDLFLSGSEIQVLPEDLVVKGTLRLTGSKIVELPSTIKAGVIDCHEMSRIVVPDDAHYSGSLFLRKATEVVIGQNVQVDGYLDLCSVANLEELPPGLKVGGALHLWGSSVKHLGANTEIGGDFNLQRSEVVELPEGLIVGGKLTICADGSGWNAWYPKITSLPPKMRVGSLYIQGTLIRELPKDLVVKNALEIGKEITRIPMQLNLTGHLVAGNIEYLPAGSSFGGGVYLRVSPISVIDSITVMGEADFQNSKLQALTGECKFGGDLILPPTIDELPEELHVAGTLEIGSRLNKSVALKRLPRKLHAGKLIIKKATIESWPEEIQVDGDIILRDGGTIGLPASLTEVNGSLHLSDSISELPDSLRVIHGDLEANRLANLGLGPLLVEGDVVLRNHRLRSLPKGLTVAGNLDLHDQQHDRDLKNLPSGLRVGGRLILPMQRILMPLPDDLEVGDEIWWTLPDWSEPSEFSQNLETLMAITEKWEARKEGRTLILRHKVTT